MKVTLVGTGCGPVPEVQADYVVGAARLLEGVSGQKDAATKAEDILRLLLDSNCEHCAVFYSGDTGFYSGARTLFPLLAERGIETEARPVQRAVSGGKAGPALAGLDPVLRPRGRLRPGGGGVPGEARLFPHRRARRPSPAVPGADTGGAGGAVRHRRRKPGL